MGRSDRELIVDFLEQWRANPPQPNKAGKARGDLKQIRGMLRARYPQYKVGSHFNFNTIRAALETRREWDKWREELFAERKEKSARGKQRKEERKALRKQKNAV